MDPRDLENLPSWMTDTAPRSTPRSDEPEGISAGLSAEDRARNLALARALGLAVPQPPAQAEPPAAVDTELDTAASDAAGPDDLQPTPSALPSGPQLPASPAATPQAPTVPAAPSAAAPSSAAPVNAPPITTPDNAWPIATPVDAWPIAIPANARPIATITAPRELVRPAPSPPSGATAGLTTPTGEPSALPTAQSHAAEPAGGPATEETPTVASDQSPAATVGQSTGGSTVRSPGTSVPQAGASGVPPRILTAVLSPQMMMSRAQPTPAPPAGYAEPFAAQGQPVFGLAVPMPQSTRRFLEPLVGIDPATVRVYEAAHDAAQTRGADALTVGDDIVLAAGQAGASPQALGLLAHELTHVALSRQGPITPPIAQDRAAAIGPTDNLDEESLARRVEARVIGAAEVLVGPHSSTAPASTEPLQLTPPDSAPAGPQPVPSTPPADAQPAADASWGGLPAPWQPLPSWMTDASVDVGPSMMSSFAPGWTAAPTNGTSPAAVAAAPAASAPTGGGAQMAELGRDLESIQRDQTAAPPAAGPAPGPVPPDLDALAQQVYSILRRRLSAESRRLR